MKTRLSTLQVFCITLLNVWIGCATAQQPVRVEGVVTASNGEPLGGVVVQVSRAGVAPVETERHTGRYRIELPSGGPIGKLSYSHSDYDYGVVELLSGTQSHSISKVLYKPGEARPLVAVVDTLGAYEQLAVSLWLAPSDQRQALAAEYRKQEWQARLSKLPIPPGGPQADWLASRKKQLYALLIDSIGK